MQAITQTKITALSQSHGLAQTSMCVKYIVAFASIHSERVRLRLSEPGQGVCAAGGCWEGAHSLSGFFCDVEGCGRGHSGAGASQSGVWEAVSCGDRELSAGRFHGPRV